MYSREDVCLCVNIQGKGSVCYVGGIMGINFAMMYYAVKNLMINIAHSLVGFVIRTMPGSAHSLSLSLSHTHTHSHAHRQCMEY